jgi:transposase-like protein
VDLKVGEVALVQYQCWGCGASVTVCPPGVKLRCCHSTRTKAISVVLWGLGLSYRNVSRVMKGLGLAISDVGVLLNVRAMGSAAMAKQKKLAASTPRVPVLGADETEVKLSGNGVTVGFLTDPATGEIVGMEVLASREGEALARWIGKAARAFGATVLVSDDLEAYKPAAETLGLDHQVCLAHVRKAVTLRLKRIPGFEQEKAVIRHALQELSPQAKRDLKRLQRVFASARPPGRGEKQSPAYAMRMCLLHVVENWPKLTCYQRDHERLKGTLARTVPRTYAVPATNNATENAIGRGGKLRAKRMRGFKRADTLLPILFFLASLGGVLAGVPLNSLMG